ncbi:hypothetical protein SAMN05660420_02638 [Desulfuromusa kysingii]|uniref:Porin n=1 Tax=Desulfuromusa kysingii TaxID=37625 RepID=A0A1H4CN90_9BACT|nr:hypothetical protein [Desulfuromusa kysingii]SEA61931.1 hypothetical protein SAMN05660420_02638 [Desulfuromusa kysingii]
MSRFLKVMIVLLAIAAMVTPAMAEDRLSLNGELRVRGWYKDNYTNFNDEMGSNQYIDQRFRLGGTIAVSEGVAIKFQYDLFDSQWNGNSHGTQGLNDGDNKAYLVINKGMFTLKAGDQYYGIANAIAIDTTGTGFVVEMAGPVGVEFAAFKRVEGDTSEDDDADLYTLAVKHATDLYSGTGFVGYYRNGAALTGDDPETAYVLGVAADFNLDAAKVMFEANYFDGDNGMSGANEVDYKGLQFFVDGSVAVSEAVTVGGIFTYAKGYDGADEAQITEFTDDGSFMPETYGTTATLFDIYPGSTFDPTGDRLGTIGVQGYSAIKLSDDLSMKATIFYAQPEEDYASGDTTTSNYDSFLGGVVSSTYAIAKGAAIDTSVAYTTVDAGNSYTEDDPSLTAGFRLRVRF